MSKLREEVLKLAREVPETRKHLVPLLRKHARLTPEKLRLKYMDLGDFGGTHPTTSTWILDVEGPTYEYKDQLKRLGLQWDPSTKMWSLRTSLPKNMYPPAVKKFDAIRKKQERAYPLLKKLVDEHNSRVDSEIEKLKGGPEEKDPKALMKEFRRSIRMNDALKKVGIIIGHHFPDLYSTGEGKVTATGDTYDIRDLMKKFGWKWDSSMKNWWLPMADWNILWKKWGGEVLRRLK